MAKPTYEVAALELGDVIAAPSVTRPTNYTRSLFHLASGAFSLTLLHLIPGRGWLIAVSVAVFVAGWSMEIARRRSPAVNEVLMRFFSPIAHAHERHGINSSTWYTTALLLLALFAPLRAAELAVVVLAVADPAAGFIGRRYGRTRLRAGRSLEGTLAFVTAGALVSLAVLAAFYALPWSSMVVLAFAGATAGALAELVSTRLDDNFTIPVSVAIAVGAAQMLLPAG